MGGQESLLKPLVDKLASDNTVISIQSAEWEALWDGPLLTIEMISESLSFDTIRTMKTTCPKNVATLCRILILKLHSATKTAVGSTQAQVQVLNTVRILTRLIACLFEDSAWNGFWMTPTPLGVVMHMPPRTNRDILSSRESKEPILTESVENAIPLAHTLLNAILDLLFAPEFTCNKPMVKLMPFNEGVPWATRPLDQVEMDQFYWTAGIEFKEPRMIEIPLDQNKIDILRLLLACLSSPLYLPFEEVHVQDDPWLKYLTGGQNPKALALFKNMINTFVGYDPVGIGFPYNYVMLPDTDRERLVQLCGEVIGLVVNFSNHNVIVPLPLPDPSLRQNPISHSDRFVSLNYQPSTSNDHDDNVSMIGIAPMTTTTTATTATIETTATTATTAIDQVVSTSSAVDATTTATTTIPTVSALDVGNVLLQWLLTINQEEDMKFLLDGFINLLTNPLVSRWLPAAQKVVRIYQELIVLFWKLTEGNSKFRSYLLKTSDVLKIIVPLLHDINTVRKTPSQIGLVQVGIDILLLLSSERNFAVRLNKIYDHQYTLDVPAFTGNHADLLILVIYNLLTEANYPLRPFYDCLLTIIVNVSPFIKSLSMTSSTKLVTLFESFSSKKFLFANETNHHLIFLLLEIFNNLIQYQIDGNYHLTYVIVRKRELFWKVRDLTVDGPALPVVDESIQAMQQVPDEVVFPDGVLDKIESRSMIISWLPSTTLPHFSVDEQNQTGARLRPVEQEFIPTQDWLVSWKRILPLESIDKLLKVLYPQIERLCVDKRVTYETEIIEFLKQGTLVGLLPVPHALFVRKYQHGTTLNSDAFYLYFWGVIYLEHLAPPLWHGTNVKLFEIQLV